MKIGFSVAALSGIRHDMSQYALPLTHAFPVHADQHQFVLFVLEGDLSMFSLARTQTQVIPVPESVREPSKNFLWHQLMLPRLARDLQLDVLHVPNHRRMPWRSPCPTVATVQPLTASQDRPSFFDRHIARWLAQRQNEIIADTECARDEACACFGLPARRVTVVGNGINHQRFFAAPRESAKAGVAQRHGLDQPFFVYAAPLEYPESNHLRLIEAFYNFKARVRSPWKLVLVGREGDGVQLIKDAIRSSLLEQDICCLGEVSDAELADLYRAADVFVYPTLRSTNGMIPIEAMACGCPVISSDRGPLRETVGRSAATIDPENPEEILDQMIRMAESAELREHWRLASLARARCFQWQKTVAGTLEVYGQAMEGSKLGREVFALAH